VVVYVNRSDNVVQLYDRHGQQIQDVPLPGYGLILSSSFDLFSYIVDHTHTRAPFYINSGFVGHFQVFPPRCSMIRERSSWKPKR